MSKIAVTAHAKINLFLHITGKRDDGYHLLESLVAFTEYGDLIEVEPANDLSLSITGQFANDISEVTQEKNLVWKAAKLLSNSRGAKITLTKNLPVASGIGGGSADAAATIKALQKLWNINLLEVELQKILLSLGSDVPVCCFAKTAMMRGIGEEITPAKLPEEKYIILVNPNLTLSTAEVFANFNLQDENKSENHLEPAAIKKLPIIADIISEISQTNGCSTARMSGSGATCFGLYKTAETAKSAREELQKKYPNFWCVESKLI